MFALGVIGAVLAAGGLAYSIYAGQRATRAQEQAMADAKNDVRLQQEREDARIRQERIESQNLALKQEQEQAATNERIRKENADALEAAKTSLPGLQDKLGADLLEQQNRAYAKMSPQIEARLAALGLLNSGALVDAQARAQGDLEAQRQARLSDFSTNATQRLNIDIPLAQKQADVDRLYQDMRERFNTDSNNLSQNFASGANAAQNDVARSQYVGGMQSAYNSAQQAQASSYLNASTQLGSGLMGYAASRMQKQPNTSLDALYKMRGGWSSGGNYYA